MVDTAGMKRYRGPSYKHPLYYRPAKPIPPVVLPSDEEIARRRAASDKFAEEAIARLQSSRILEAIVDTEARIAVEGDTAMDDVPFGESGE